MKHKHAWVGFWYGLGTVLACLVGFGVFVLFATLLAHLICR